MAPKHAAALPQFIEPMYATPVRELPEGPYWIYEAKLDGYRCLAASGSSGDVVLWSGRGLPFCKRFPEIAKACEPLPPDTIIDGEVIAIDSTGEISFNALQHQNKGATLQYYVFDVLRLQGKSLLEQPLDERQAALNEVLGRVDYPVIRSQSFTAAPHKIVRAAKELGLEGVIAKRRNSPYEPGRRSHSWLKFKINRGQEFVIGGFTHGHPFDALIVGYYDDAGDLIYAAKVRAGFVPLVRRDVSARFAGLTTDMCPFANLPERKRTQWALTLAEMKNCVWLRPELVVQIEFTEWTPDGHLRHASFVGLRDDKDSKDVGRET